MTAPWLKMAKTWEAQRARDDRAWRHFSGEGSQLRGWRSSLPGTVAALFALPEWKGAQWRVRLTDTPDLPWRTSQREACPVEHFRTYKGRTVAWAAAFHVQRADNNCAACKAEHEREAGVDILVLELRHPSGTTLVVRLDRFTDGEEFVLKHHPRWMAGREARP